MVKEENYYVKLIEFVNEIKPDLIVTLAYGQIVPEGVLNIPKYEQLVPRYNYDALILPPELQATVLYFSNKYQKRNCEVFRH